MISIATSGIQVLSMESVIELLWGFPKIRGTPIAGWFIVENAIKMDYDWGYTPIYGNRHITSSWWLSTF